MSNWETNQESNTIKERIINEQERKTFAKAYKRGTYKEMHAKKLLTDQQLNQLLNRLC